MKHIKTLCYTLIILFMNTIVAYADYLPPQIIDGQDCYNLYDVVEIKKGTQKNISSLIYGDGKEFYINNCFIRIYENSIVYYLNNKYIPIQLQEFSSNGNTIKLPSNDMVKINTNSFYLTKQQIRDFFEIDVESKGILYEKEEEEIQALGVDFHFLENNLSSLGYQYMGSGYYYEKDGIINNYVFFHDDSITIQWYYNQSEEIVDLVLQALFPNSYSLMKGNIFGLNGNYDNRHVETQVNEDYIFIEISNITNMEENSLITENTSNIQENEIIETETNIEYEDYTE